MAVPTTDCVMCHKPDSMLCTQCKGCAYCSKECQKADWPSHKLVCRIFAQFDLETRPSIDHYRAVLLPENDSMPRIIWVEWTSYDVAHLRELLFPEKYSHAYGQSKLVEFTSPAILDPRANKAKEYLRICSRECSMSDGSVRCKAAIKATSPYGKQGIQWRGPVIITARRFYDKDAFHQRVEAHKAFKVKFGDTKNADKDCTANKSDSEDSETDDVEEDDVLEEGWSVDVNLAHYRAFIDYTLNTKPHVYNF